MERLKKTIDEIKTVKNNEYRKCLYKFSPDINLEEYTSTHKDTNRTTMDINIFEELNKKVSGIFIEWMSI